MLKPWFLGPPCVPGVNRMTEVTISEQMTRMTRRAIAIPFQFLCGGLLPTSSCRQRRDVVRKKHKKHRHCKENKHSYRRTEESAECSIQEITG